jgi:alkylation response protein AidB-like acyl-CoA dehydrogenase
MTMDFWESDDLAAHRDAARAWADRNVRPEWAEEQRRPGWHQTMALHARLAEDGILGAGWPAEYGGSGVDLDFARAVFDETARRGLQSDGWSTTVMVAHTILQVATEEQKRAYLPAILRGEMFIALGYSEPGSGSDVAAAKTTAVRVPGNGAGDWAGTEDGEAGAGWVINGQKMFTSTAQLATHVFVLARTNPDAPSTRGSRSSWCRRPAPALPASRSTPSAGRSPTRPSTPTSACPTWPASALSTRAGT